MDRFGARCLACLTLLAASLAACTSPLLGPSNPPGLQKMTPMSQEKNLSTPDSPSYIPQPDESPRSPHVVCDPRWLGYNMTTFASRPIKWDKSHAIDVCAGAMARALFETPSAVLFPGKEDEILIDNATGEGYHAHLLVLAGSKVISDTVHRFNSKEFPNRIRLSFDPATGLQNGQRALLAIVTQAFRNTNPEVETLIPPTLFVVELKARSEAEGVLSSQRFGYKIGRKDPLWLTILPHTSVDQAISIISLANHDIADTQIAHGDTAFNSNFRVAVRSQSKGVIHQKASLYPFPLNVTPDQAGSPVLRVIDKANQSCAKIPNAPKPVIMPTSRRVKTEADVITSFYGFVSDARYRFTSFYGYADESEVRYVPEAVALDASKKTAARNIKLPTKEPTVIVLGHYLSAFWDTPSSGPRHQAIEFEREERSAKLYQVSDSPYDWITFLGPDAPAEPDDDGMGTLGYASLSKMGGLGPMMSLVQEDGNGTGSGSTSGSNVANAPRTGQAQIGAPAQGQGGKSDSSAQVDNKFNIQVFCGHGGPNPGPRDFQPETPVNGGYIPTPGGWSYPTPESPLPYGPYVSPRQPGAPPYMQPAPRARAIP